MLKYEQSIINTRSQFVSNWHQLDTELCFLLVISLFIQFLYLVFSSPQHVVLLFSIFVQLLSSERFLIFVLFLGALVFESPSIFLRGLVCGLGSRSPCRHALFSIWNYIMLNILFANYLQNVLFWNKIPMPPSIAIHELISNKISVQCVLNVFLSMFMIKY